MATPVDRIYEETIKPLPPADRLRLATRILNDIPPESVVDDHDEWSDEDLRDFSAAGLTLIDRTLAHSDDA